MAAVGRGPWETVPVERPWKLPAIPVAAPRLRRTRDGVGRQPVPPAHRRRLRVLHRRPVGRHVLRGPRGARRQDRALGRGSVPQADQLGRFVGVQARQPHQGVAGLGPRDPRGPRRAAPARPGGRRVRLQHAPRRPRQARHLVRNPEQDQPQAGVRLGLGVRRVRPGSGQDGLRDDGLLGPIGPAGLDQTFPGRPAGAVSGRARRPHDGDGPVRVDHVRAVPAGGHGARRVGEDELAWDRALRLQLHGVQQPEQSRESAPSQLEGGISGAADQQLPLRRWKMVCANIAPSAAQVVATKRTDDRSRQAVSDRRQPRRDPAPVPRALHPRPVCRPTFRGPPAPHREQAGPDRAPRRRVRPLHPRRGVRAPPRERGHARKDPEPRGGRGGSAGAVRRGGGGIPARGGGGGQERDGDDAGRGRGHGEGAAEAGEEDGGGFEGGPAVARVRGRRDRRDGGQGGGQRGSGQRKQAIVGEAV